MNRLLKNRRLNTWLGFLIALSLFLLTIYISNHFVEQLRAEEKSKVEVIAKAQEVFANSNSLETPTQDLLIKILQNNQSIPIIVVDEAGLITESRNVPDNLLQDQEKIQDLLREMKAENQPITINLKINNESLGKQFIYYKNSFLLTQLQYYPIILVCLIALFIYFSYWYFTTLKNTQQSYLWAGMAKETAHQIGTPLSSLLGWIELLKLEEVSQEPILQMENDVKRLNQIAERFSKIGSLPELKEQNLVPITKKSYDYLKKRVSKNIEFEFYANQEQILVPINESLYSWVIENLIRNAADAMSNQGKIVLSLKNRNNQAQILVQDSGSGIAKSLQKRIFEPGYTTKKRGWGLGLSLAKRIINDYHQGKIEVLSSDKTGTTFRILLKKNKKDGL